MEELNWWKAILISISDIDRCPITSFSPEHYNEDGSCKCEECAHGYPLEAPCAACDRK